MFHKQLIVLILIYLKSTDNVGNLKLSSNKEKQKANFIKINYHVKHVKKRVGTSNKTKVSIWFAWSIYENITLLATNWCSKILIPGSRKLALFF